MEDEDNENGLVDKWTLFEEAYYKGAGINTSLAQINNLNVSADDIDETREDCFYSSYPQESGGNGNSSVNLKNVIKGFTKNILKAQPEENQADSLNDILSAEKAQSNDTSKQETNNKVEVKDKNMAEYAQYLGLQPAASKPECSKCHTRKSNTSAGESNQDECDCSAEESSQADANSSKLSLVNNVELPSTSSSKPPCTENSHLSSLDDPESLPTNNCNSQPADAITSSSSEVNRAALASPSMSPFADASEVSCADRPKSPDAEVPESATVETPQSLPAEASPSPAEIPTTTAELSPSPTSETSLSPTLEISSSPASEVAKSPSAEEPQSLCADVPMSPSIEEASQSSAADEPMSITEEAFQSPSVDPCISPMAETPKSPLDDACMSPEADTPKSPLVDACMSPEADTPKSPLVDACMSPEAGTPKSPLVEACASPVADTPKSPFVDASMSLAAEAPKSPSVDACMSPATETPKSPQVETSKSQDDTLVPPSSDASQSPVSNDIEFLSTGSPKPQHSGSESPASNCSQPPTVNICESASCDSSELPHAEGSQSPPQISMELSCDSNSKELHTDSSEVSSDKYEPVPSTSYEEPVPSTSYGEPIPSTSYEEPTPSTSYEEPIPSTSSCGSTSTKTLDSSSSSSGASSTSQTSNFKITNKVYLCAACETYFENWNLFTHMREVHQRHICLFCLGMFGQAERLSHHLLKKHNVSDMNFNSAEEFFKVFIGPCYVVCCKCDKMFTETDNFENHPCPPQQAVQSTSGVCSQCKKVDSHAEGCTLAPEKSDNTEVLQSSPNSARTTKVEPVKTNQTVTNVIRHSKRTIKPNRHNDDIYLYTKLTNIRTKRSKLQSTSETSDCSDTHKDNTEITEVTRNSFSDTPMEVDSGADNKTSFQNDRLENDSHESESEILNRVSAKDTYDSITETIMEVSQGTNHNESAHTNSNLENTLDCSTSKGTVESSEPKDEDDVRLKENNATPDETKELHLEPNSFDNANENDNSDSESQASDSSSEAADESFNTNDKVPTPTKKEQNKPVLSATPVTDRSLVIKICTKNNSVYSIKTPSHVENSIENHDSSRESEENNNSEESDKAPAAEESVKEDVQETNPDGEKMDVTENCENDLGSINFDSDVNKENKSEVNNQLDKKSEENCNLDEKPVDDTMDNKIDNFDGIPLAGEEISVVDLDVDDLLENMELENLLKRCIKAVCGICVYCNHTRQIAVNGKQLSLHMLSEHRFQPQHPAIIINQEQFIAKVKKCFNELDSYYFNLDSYNTKQGTYNVSMVKTYECFHCRFYSNSHKELYLHNRKMHQKPILICIMCKSTFLSYSELLCHLCPGVYAANVDIKYRCCFCNVSNIPSAFRLMVHLRKLHHACDVCLETTGNQQNLSNHVWKHKLHHLCYRCGIAYRNKPDITKHLFWKHGTESVLCKKCLQKKWPYIYHFCVPPTDFHCEECGFTCHRAVALKVHKRIHVNEYPYSCSECPEKLISKKLLAKHEKSHREPEPPPPPVIAPVETKESQTVEEDVHVDVCNTEVKENEVVETVVEETPKEPVKKVVDVLDLPPLNLSDSDSDSEDEKTKPEENKSKEESEKIEIDVVDKPETIPSGSPTTTEPVNDVITEIVRNETEKKQEEQIMDGIWDNFKSYTASLEKQESMEVDSEKPAVEDARTKEETENLKKAILADHDYCVVYPNKGEEGQSPTSQKTEETDKAKLPVERTPSPSPTSKPQSAECESPKKKAKTPKKKKQNTSGSSSDSSSDSDSSNCSCGTGCSCSSSSSSGSSSSSSSSDSDSSSSDSPKKASREKRKKAKAAAKVEEKNVVIAEAPEEPKQEPVEVKIDIEVTPIEPPKPVIPVLVIRESDLETTESDTDEEFYDENPQQTASKLLAEKRKQTLLASGIPADAAAAPVNGVIDTDPSSAAAAASPGGQVEAPPVTPATKRKFKTRKRRKGLWGKARTPAKTVESIKVNIPKTSYQRRGAPRGRRHSTVSNVSSVSVFEANQMMTAASGSYARTHSLGGSGSEMDSTRSSKRKRVPKRFYDDSSDEENHMQRMLKWRRTDAPPLVTTPSPSPSSSKQSFQQQQQLLLQQQQQQQQLLIQQQQQLIMQQQQQQLIIQQQQQQLQYQQEQLLQAQRQQQQQYQQHNDDNDDEEKALVIAASDSDSNDSSSSDSSDSENETTAAAAAAKNEVPAVPPVVETSAPPGSQTLYHTNYPQMHPIIPERSSNLYCYCQCPYDEVSEMIACDGDDCQIEWFHFECVGISVPPKGKWFCPDCRKNLGMSDEEMTRG